MLRFNHFALHVLTAILIRSSFGAVSNDLENRFLTTLNSSACLNLIDQKTSAGNSLLNLIKNQKVLYGAVNDDDLSLKALIDDPKNKVKLSQFLSLGDTLKFSENIEKALEIADLKLISGIVDFFSGSSIPTIRILSNNEIYSNLQVTAIEIDPGAIVSATANVEALGLSNNFNMINSDVIKWIKNNELRNHNIYAFNPPYIPTEEKFSNNYHYTPISAGPKGTKYFKEILNSDFEKDTILATTWSSLTSPREMLQLITVNYDVLSIQITETQFGTYTSSNDILPYLIELRNQGEVIFNEFDGKFSYWIISTILKRK